MEKCPNCQLTTDLGASYCGNCGSRLLAPGSHLAPAYNLPAYSFEPVILSQRKGEIEAIFGLLLGVSAIPVAFFSPLLALLIALVGIVLGTIGRSQNKHPISLFAIIFSVIGLAAGLSVWGYAVTKNPALKLAEGSNNPTTSLVGINTPCYRVKIDAGLSNYRPNNCSFDASSRVEEFSVNAISNSNINASNLSSVAHQIFSQAIAKTGGTYLLGSAGEFNGSQAYYVNAANAANNTMSVFAMVLHQSAGLDNVYILSRAVRTTYQPSLGELETSWSWK